MKYLMVNELNRQSVNDFISERWFSTEMIIRGTIIDMTKVNGIIALENDEIVGLLTYTFSDTVCEITSLDSVVEGKGIGTSLINQIRNIAKEHNCAKIVVVTTNDNINAIRFYQKRGFDMARFYHNALDISRKIKPSIPLIGDNDIPLKHEIEFEIILPK